MKRMVAPALLLVALSFFALSGSKAFKSASTTLQTSRTPAPPASRHSPYREVPTRIQGGVMTPKQKLHSKIFKKFGGGIEGRRLRDLPANNGEVLAIEPVGEVPKIRNFTVGDYLALLKCKANAVVIGVVKSKASQLTEDGTFTFTDYEFQVEEVLKDNVTAPIQSNSNVTVTRPGGAVELNGKVIRAVDHRTEPLEAGKRYLLFLEFIPATGAYKPPVNSISGDSFLLLDDKAVQVSKNTTPLGPRAAAPLAQFLHQVRDVIPAPCGGKQ